MALLIAPAPEGVDDRLAVLVAVGKFALALELAFADDRLVPVERTDQGERLGASLGLVGLGVLKPPPAVRLTWISR